MTDRAGQLSVRCRHAYDCPMLPSRRFRKRVIRSLLSARFRCAERLMMINTMLAPASQIRHAILLAHTIQGMTCLAIHGRDVRDRVTFGG